MKSKDEKAVADRRNFLKIGSIGAVGSAAALVSETKPAKADAEPAPGQLYRETEHIRTYYKLAR